MEIDKSPAVRVEAASLSGQGHRAGASVVSDAVRARVSQLEDVVTYIGPAAEQVVALFHTLINADKVGHTIFGAKPLTTVMFPCERSAELDQWHHLRRWFVSDNFVLRRTGYHSDPALTPEPFAAEELFIYNRREIARVFEQNRGIFQRVLGTGVQVNTIFQELDHADSLAGLFGGSALLSGIVLGFGAANADAFARRDELSERIARSSGNGSERVLKQVSPRPGQISAADEFGSVQFAFERSLHQQLASGRNLSTAVQFVAMESHPESIELRAAYERSFQFGHRLRGQEGERFMSLLALAQWRGSLVIRADALF